VGAKSLPDVPVLSNANYNKPLNFEILSNGLTFLPVQVEYEVVPSKESPNGDQLKLGPLAIDSQSFVVNMDALKNYEPKLADVLGHKAYNQTFVAKWTRELFPIDQLKNPFIELVSDKDQVEWKLAIKKEDLTEWSLNLSEWEELLTKEARSSLKNNPQLYKSQYGHLDLTRDNTPFWKIAAKNPTGNYKFCLKAEKSLKEKKGTSKIDSKVRLCSAYYNFVADKSGFDLRKVSMDPAKNVISNLTLQDQKVTGKGVLKPTIEKPLDLVAEWTSGFSYEVYTRPCDLDITDLILNVKDKTVNIKGYGCAPHTTNPEVLVKEKSWLSNKLNFKETIGDFRLFWKLSIPQSDLSFYVPGEFGGLFKQSLELEEPPVDNQRIYLAKNTPTGTYNDEIIVEGLKQPSFALAHEKNYSENFSDLQVDPQNPMYLKWKVQSPKKGTYNKDFLWMDTGKQKYRTYFEVYRGFAQELSTRLTLSNSGGQFITMGELAYNVWFENFLGSRNYYFGRQRWGASLKRFQNISQFKVEDKNTNMQSVDFNSLIADLKYRFNPGIWERDESTGMMLSYQNLNYSDLPASMLGVGWFWARSMPSNINYYFSKLPYMNFDKWVDMELIYYAQSLDSHVSLEPGNLALNFHGKVLWRSNFFGEMGFGLKEYAYTNKKEELKAELSSYYATFGLGFNF
jgi:hypothetical protein